MKPAITSAIASALAVMAISCSGGKGSAADASATSATSDSTATPTEALAAKLRDAAASGRYYFGHHDDTAYGHTWEYVDGASDVKAVTGQYPGMMSWDLGMIELDSARNLDGVPFDFMASEMARQDARGGINAISWHVRNPMGGTSWDVDRTPLRELAAEGAVRDTLTAWIDRAARYVGSLKDSDGRPLAVIFRPWHENSGSWFWWGKDHGTPEEFKALWRLTRERFDAAGVDNVLWAYSPDKDLTLDDYLSTYPGDEYVDILGSDIYHFNGEEGTEQYVARVKAQLPVVAAEAAKRGKIAAFTETGLEGLAVADWYTRVLAPAIEGIPLAYVCVWRNAIESRKAGHFYVPYPGHPAEKDFKEFHTDGRAIFVD